jgi:hypothetical protein
MFGRLRHWAEAGTALLGLAFAVSAGPGYLPVVGPAPLRFQAGSPPSANLVKMPLPPPDPPSSAAKSTSAAPPSAADAQTNVAPATAVLLTATNNPVAPEAAPASSEPKISPEMLLKFFTPSTNGPAGGVIAPLDFTPPAMAKPASSTATYSTQPK